MADTKITALTAITTVDPAADVLPIVDVSDTSMAASGTTKKITTNQLLGASGTATLASATISGDLTVDTSTLKVDSANNRVGIGTATPATPLNIGTAVSRHFLANGQTTGSSYGEITTTGADVIYGAVDAAAGLFTNAIANASFFGSGNATSLQLVTNSTSRYEISSTGVATWSNVGGVAGTAMTLNSTGLGVGGSPSTRLHIQNTGDVYARIATTSVSKAGVQFSANGVVRSHLLYDDGAGTTYLTTGTSFGGSGQALAIQSGTSLSIYTNNQLATAQMTLDASGNLVIGKTSALARLDVASTRAASVVGGVIGTTGTGSVNDEVQFLIKNVNTASGQNNGAGVGALLEASASNKSSLLFYVDNGTAVTNVGRFDSNGNLILQSSATPATLATNGQLTMNATSNTNLRFSYRGSDGITRVANITLA